MISKKETLRSSEDTRIAIVGMSCRFPGGACNPEAYWNLMKNKIDTTTEIPRDRWDIKRFYNPDPEAPGKSYVARGAFLKESIEQFEPGLFGISIREATPLDPQQRLLLELTWEAFEDAGIVAGTLAGAKCGVYMGGFTLDNQIHLLNPYNRETITTHTAISSTIGMLSNRISYVFDLRGPSVTVDSACSSSAVAIHLACKDLLRSDCSIAVTGGVNVMMRPEYMIAMCKGGFLAKDGRCKTFDKSADGYGRGEGAGVLILKRLTDAINDGDRIHAVIVDTAINQDGHSDGITAPSSEAQTRLLKELYERACISPDEVQYIEAHGTGTQAGDKAETNSIGKAIATKRSGSSNLIVGSCKTNIGHTEGAAAVAAVIKTVLCLKNKAIPPNVNFKEPNPEIDFAKLRLQVPVEMTPWPDHQGLAHAGVNSFGFGGTNAHIILEEAPFIPPHEVQHQHRPLLFPFTAATSNSLLERIRKASALLEKNLDQPIENIGYTLGVRQSHLKHRYVAVASTMAELREKLYSFNAKKATAYGDAVTGPRKKATDVKCAFIFTGMGPQYWGMGIELLKQDKNARRIFDKCDEIWKPMAGWSLEELFSKSTGTPMNEPWQAQPANLVLQLMLVEMADSYGLTAEGVLGHSVGEIAAAYVAGSITLEEALTITYHRSRLQQQMSGKGKMLAVGLSQTEITPYLEGLEDSVSIAAVNSFNSVTLSGDPQAIQLISEKLTADGCFNRMLVVETAYHSYQMEPLANEFIQGLNNISPKTPFVPLYSSVTGKQVRDSIHNAQYWWKNLRNTVYFSDALEQMIKDGYNTFLEIGPHPVLASAIRDELQSIEGETFALQNRRQPQFKTFCLSIAALFARGVSIDWKALYPSGNLFPLGTYPWDKETVWDETEISKADRLGIPGHPLLKSRVCEPIPAWDGELSLFLQGYLNDHRIQEEIIFPGAGFVEMALAANLKIGSQIVLEDFKFYQTLEVLSTPVLRLAMDSDGESFNIFSRSFKSDSAWTKNAGGKMYNLVLPETLPSLNRDNLLIKLTESLDIDSFYRLTQELGLEYGPGFKTLKHGFIGKDEIITEIEIHPDYAHEAAEYYLHPTLLDGAFQSLLALAMDELRKGDKLFIPYFIKNIYFYKKPGINAWCHAKITERNSQNIYGELEIYDNEDNLCVKIKGMAVKGIVVKTKANRSKMPTQYINQWLQVPLPAVSKAAQKPQTWLVFSDKKGIGAQLIRNAVSQRVSCIEVRAGQGFKQCGDSIFEVKRNSRPDIEKLFLGIADMEIDAVVYLWGLDIQDKSEPGYGPYASGTIDVVDLTHVVQSMNTAFSDREIMFCIGLCRAQSVEKDTECRNPGQNALIGFGRVMALEYPNYHVKTVDLNSFMPFIAASNLFTELKEPDRETEVAYRDNIRYAGRLVRFEPENQKYQADKDTSFVYQSELQRFAETERRTPYDGEIEIAVNVCYPINLSSVVHNPGGVKILSYCAGTITQTGTNISGLTVNQKVAVLKPQENIQSFITLSSNEVFPIPEGFSFEDAVVLPEWIIAYDILFEKGKLQPGETVFVYQIPGKIQLAAILLAKWKGATVFAAHAEQGVRDYLKAIGADYVLDSRNFEFLDTVLSETDGKGVDIIVSTPGLLMQKSIELIARDGRYLCIDEDSSAYEQIPVSAFKREIQFYVIDIKAFCFDYPQKTNCILNQLKPVISNLAGRKFGVKFSSVMKLPELLKMHTRGGTFDDFVLNVHGQPVPLSSRLTYGFIQSDASYIVTGGWGGFGMVTLRWLAEQGARYIIVFSRSGNISLPAQDILKKLQTAGVQVLNEKVDISDRVALMQAIDKCQSLFPEIKGVIHTAGVIDDADLDSLTDLQIHTVMNAKALGAWNLHNALINNPLDFFICYSSISSLLGNISQANYAAANAFLDGLMQYRRGLGLNGLSINWGAIEDVGMVARDERLKAHLAQIGLKGISSQQGLKCILPALSGTLPQIGIFEMDWKQHAVDFAVQTNRLSSLVDKKYENSFDDTIIAFREKILREKNAQRIFAVTNEVIQIVASIFKIESSRIESNSDLVELGIDSLMAQELAMDILKQTGVRFRALYLLRGRKISEISEIILNEIIEGNKLSLVAVR